jgi:hypothetical protein
MFPFSDQELGDNHLDANEPDAAEAVGGNIEDNEDHSGIGLG